MRVAIVGGAGGIGRALVARAIERGLTPWVFDLPATLERHPPSVDGTAIDATDEASIASALARQRGPFDALVNLCGFGIGRQPLLELDEAALRMLVDGNLLSAWRLSRAFAPHLRAGGAMVHVASGLGARAVEGYGGYGMAKAGLLMLVKHLALELAPAIRVNAVAPSAIDTAFLRGGTGRGDERAPLALDVEAYARTVPLGRIGEPDDVALPILFLISADARYITGQTLHVNGGLYMA